jgi:DNA-binding CsgD family transcriptional regulator
MVINIIVSVLNTVVAAMSYMKFTAVVCAVIDTVAFVIFSKVHSDPLTFSFIGTLVLMHVSILAMGFLLSNNAYKLQNENVLMKQDEETMLKKLNISKEGINAYFEVASTSDPTFEQVDKLFSSMDEKAQRNLTNAVRIHKVRQASKENILSSTFPQLSKSELEVCELILMGKKLTDICSILGKNESNINSVRVHIRQKIGIPHGVNLSEYLEAEIIHKNKVIPSDS